MTKRQDILVPALFSALALAAPPALAGDLAAGKEKAESVCQVCHGLDGQASVPMAANLSGQQKDYLIVQLHAFREGRRQHEQMSIVAQMLTDDDIENVAEWYSNIKVTVEEPK